MQPYFYTFSLNNPLLSDVNIEANEIFTGTRPSPLKPPRIVRRKADNRLSLLTRSTLSDDEPLTPRSIHRPTLYSRHTQDSDKNGIVNSTRTTFEDSVILDDNETVHSQISQITRNIQAFQVCELSSLQQAKKRQRTTPDVHVATDDNEQCAFNTKQNHSTLSSTLSIQPDEQWTDQDDLWREKYMTLMGSLIQQCEHLEYFSHELETAKRHVDSLLSLASAVQDQYHEHEKLYQDQLTEVVGLASQRQSIMLDTLDTLIVNPSHHDILITGSGIIADTTVTAHDQKSVNTTTKLSSMILYRYRLVLDPLDRATRFAVLPKNQWIPDAFIDQCQQCAVPFNWFLRKHHCRSCGNIFCQKHSGNRLPLFSTSDQRAWYRICDTCFIRLVS